MKISEAQNRLARLTVVILTKIRLHKRVNPILSRQLEEEFQINGVKVREIVRLLRREGQPIASSGGDSEGYYYADTYGDIEPTLNNLKARETDLRFTRIQMLKKFNMEESLFS